MMRTRLAGLLALVVLGGSLLAADKEFKAKLVKVDADKKIVTVTNDDGKKDYSLAPTVIVTDAQENQSKDGLKDKRLVAGADVELTIPSTGKALVKEIHLLGPATAAKDPKKDVKDTKDVPEPKKDVKDTKDPKKDVKDTKDPKKDAKDTKVVKKDGNEIVGKLTKLDVDKKTFTIETEDGKKHDLTIGDDTEFLGPRGGKSDKGIKDDRFVVGHEIKVTTSGNGKVVEEIRLPYRKDK